MTPRAAGPTRPSWRQFAGIVAIFAGIGPLIGLVVISVVMTMRAFVEGKGANSLSILPLFLMYGMLFAHLVGGAFAAAAGRAGAALARWQGRVEWWAAVLIGLASWLAWLYFGRGPSMLNPAPADNIAFELLATHVGAALVCWRLAVAWAGLRR